MKNLKKLYQIMKPLKKVMILLSILAVAEAAVDSATPWVYKMIINNITDVISNAITRSEGIRNGIFIAVVLLALFVIINLIFIIRNYYSPKLEVRAQRILRERIFKHLTELSIDYFERERVGSLMAKV